MSTPKRKYKAVWIGSEGFPSNPADVLPGQISLEQAKKIASPKPLFRPAPRKPADDGQQGTSGSAPADDVTP